MVGDVYYELGRFYTILLYVLNDSFRRVSGVFERRACVGYRFPVLCYRYSFSVRYFVRVRRETIYLRLYYVYSIFRYYLLPVYLVYEVLFYVHLFYL